MPFCAVILFSVNDDIAVHPFPVAGRRFPPAGAHRQRSAEGATAGRGVGMTRMSAARRVVFRKTSFPSFVLAATPVGAALLVR
jgi:hypothetical protein